MARPFSSRARGCRTSQSCIFPGDGPNDHTAGISARCRRCGRALQRGALRACSEVRTSTISSGSGTRSTDASSRNWARPTGRRSFRDDGATSLESWIAERFGVSTPTARAYAHVGREGLGSPAPRRVAVRGRDLLRQGAGAGRRGHPRDRAGAVRPGQGMFVRELADVARSEAELARTASRLLALEHDGRFLRFNDTLPHHHAPSCRPTPTPRPRPASMRRAQGRSPPTGRHRWTSVAVTAFMALIRSSVPGSGGHRRGHHDQPLCRGGPCPPGRPGRGLRRGEQSSAGELEHGGLIDRDTVRRIACDATIVVALDDDVGHTMYEGRARRFPSDAQRREVMRRDRHCRFPGCTNVTFTNVHHIVPWKPGGRTDLDNLALLCLFHHGMVHRKGWTMIGERQCGAHLRRPERPGHDLAPLAAVDQGDGLA